MRFWISRSGMVLTAEHHWLEAVAMIGIDVPSEACEVLMRDGYLRCVITDTDLFYERRQPPTDRQMRELRNISIERGVRLCDDKGAVIFECSETPA